MTGARRRAIIKVMKALPALIATIALSLALGSCSRLDLLALEPPTSPEAWLATQPHVDAQVAGGSVVIIQPSSTLIVYGLGLLTIGVGLRFLRLAGRRGEGHGSLTLWGAALVVWGLGTLSAGTSYQAFGYMIKAAGRASVAFTSPWEVLYMMLTVASVGLMGLAVASYSTRGRGGTLLRAWAALSTLGYLAFAFAGSLLPDRFMVSFEAMILFVLPGMLAFFAVNLRAWLTHRRRPDLLLVRAWLGMALVMGLYFSYYLAGIGEALWAKGLWFSANDVLHLGLVGWMLYLGLAVAPSLRVEKGPGL